MESKADLFEWLTPRLNAQDQLRLLDRFLLPASDGSAPDPALLLARATLLQAEGRAEEAVETLTHIPQEAQSDKSLVLLIECAVAAGQRLPFRKLLDRIQNWDNAARVRRIVRALAALPEENVLPLIAHLCHLAPGYAPLVWQMVRPVLQQPLNRLALVQLLHDNPDDPSRVLLKLAPSELFDYLTTAADARQMSNVYLDYVVEAGMSSPSPSGIAPFFMEWMRRGLERQEAVEVEKVLEGFKGARQWLSTGQQEKAHLMLIQALKRVGLAEKAVWLALECSGEAKRDSAFDEAERWLREARNGVSAMPAHSRSPMLSFIKEEESNIKQARHELASSFAPLYGSDPGLAPILKLYGIEAMDAFWVDLLGVMQENEHIARQLIARLEQLQQFGQHSGSANSNIHSLNQLPGNVSRMELTDSARLVFKKVGRTIRLIALYANHDAYDEALKQRFELMNRLH